MLTLLRGILRLFWIFPIQEHQVVLTSFNGRLYNCSPKYLAIALAKHPDMQVYFAIKKEHEKNADIPSAIHQVRYASIKHFFLLMTSKYLVVNSTGVTGLLPYRKSQILINTWHGTGAFKTTGVRIFNSKKAIRKRKITAKNTTFFLTSSRRFTEDQSVSMLLSEDKFLNSGLPRNDLFFEQHPEIKERVYEHYHLDRQKKIILYAPTYRDGPVRNMKGYGFPPIDVERVIHACSQVFGGEFVFFFKAHHDMVPENIDARCINASDYTDTQELLYASDVLITDYSSIQWDFALQKKPGFLYTPDIEAYQSVHPFASDYHEWPYETALSNDELVKCIERFDGKASKQKIETYFENLGSYETGHATEMILKKVFGIQ